jgi:hypothetical protein
LYVGFENVFKLMLYEMMRDYKCLFMFDKWFAMRKMTTLYVVVVKVYTWVDLKV